MISKYVKEQKRYTQDELRKIFECTAEETVQIIRKLKEYFGKKNVTNVKECLKEGTVYGPLCAYRLFYVGCSRAKRNLVIMINKKDIEGFEDKLRNKLMTTGFNVL